MTVYGRKRRPFDWISFSIYTGLVIIGWLMIYASGPDALNVEGGRSFFSTGLLRQFPWVLFALASFLLAYLVDTKFWSTFAYPFFAISLLSLILVLIFGANVKGSTSWFQLAGFSFQPSEIAKIGAALAMASYLSHYKTNLKEFKYQITAIGIFLAPVILIMLQPDAGSAITFLSLFILLYREGMPSQLYLFAIITFSLFVFSLLYSFTEVVLGILMLSTLILWVSVASTQLKWFISGVMILGGGLLFWTELEVAGIWVFGGLSIILLIVNGIKRNMPLVIGLFPATIFCGLFAFFSQYLFYNVLQPHQQDRINVWLQPEKCDPRGSLYNVLQSKVAIGSGGFQGKGYLEGTMTKLNFVPEQNTDFIFSTIGEEQGFIGAIGIIALFVLLMLRTIRIGERATNGFQRNFAYAVAGFLFIHTFVNIGMTMGLLPIIGIPLPFISKGGSSLLAFSIMFGILLRMDRSGR